VRFRGAALAFFVVLAVAFLAAGFAPAGLRPHLEAPGCLLAAFAGIDFPAGALMVVSSIVAVAAAACSESIAFCADTWWPSDPNTEVDRGMWYGLAIAVRD
jgi:hypothetical protein